MIIFSKTCVICSSDFTKPAHYSYKQWNDKKCCSTTCKRISQAKTISGRQPWNFGKGGWKSNDALKIWRENGGKPWNRGLKGIHISPQSEFTPDKVMGSKNVNWKGGVTSKNKIIRSSRKYKEWSESVYKKYNWHCVKCGIHCQNGNIIAHHIKSFSQFPDERFNIENGVVLCRSCHAKIHNSKNRFSETPLPLYPANKTDSFGFQATDSTHFLGYIIGQNL